MMIELTNCIAIDVGSERQMHLNWRSCPDDMFGHGHWLIEESPEVFDDRGYFNSSIHKVKGWSIGQVNRSCCSIPQTLTSSTSVMIACPTVMEIGQLSVTHWTSWLYMVRESWLPPSSTMLLVDQYTLVGWRSNRLYNMIDCQRSEGRQSRRMSFYEHWLIGWCNQHADFFDRFVDESWGENASLDLTCLHRADCQLFVCQTWWELLPADFISSFQIDDAFDCTRRLLQCTATHQSDFDMDSLLALRIFSIRWAFFHTLWQSSSK